MFEVAFMWQESVACLYIVDYCSNIGNDKVEYICVLRMIYWQDADLIMIFLQEIVVLFMYLYEFCIEKAKYRGDVTLLSDKQVAAPFSFAVTTVAITHEIPEARLNNL